MPSSSPVIFLSAATVDLKDWRDSLHTAFSRAGFRVLTQDQSLRSAPGDVRRLLTETIAEADCVIHLAGMGYGSHATDPFPDMPVPSGAAPFQCSWTQFEYYHAHQQKKDVIAFVCAPDLSKRGYEKNEEGDDAERRLKSELQEKHRQRVSSGTFIGTPLEGIVPRTSNETVFNPGKLMESVAAAVGTLRTVQREEMEKAQEELRRMGGSLARLEQGQRRTGRVVLASAALLLVIAGLVFWIKHVTGRTAAAVDVVAQKQDQQTLLLTDQQTMIKEAVAQLEELTEEKARLGIKITDLPREAIYKEIAARLKVSEVELALNIEAAKKSTDALTRARAHLLARSYDDAHKSAQEARDADKAAIQRIMESHAIDAESYFQQVKYEQALESRQKAAALVDKAADPAAWTDAQNQVTFVMVHLARYKEAEPLMREIVRLREAGPRPDQRKLATALNNLAQLLTDTNRLAEAEPLMRRALEIGEASLGKDHPLVAVRLSNLAMLLKDTNRLGEAEPMMRRALEIDEASFGRDHPTIAKDLNNLALLLQATNRLAEAEPLMRRALETLEKTYGESHPDVATAISNLANLLKDTNRLAEAEPLLRRAVEIDEARVGKDHPKVAIDLHSLALLLQDTNRLAEAEPLMRRALAINEASYGKDHPDVAISLHHLAMLLKATDRLTEAEPLSRRAVEISVKFKQATGYEHRTYRLRLENYRGILEAMGLSKEAIAEKMRGLE